MWSETEDILLYTQRIKGGQELTYGRSLERHLKHLGLVDNGGKAITLGNPGAGWLKLVTKVPFDIGKPQLKGHPGATLGLRLRRSGGFGSARPLQRRSRRRRDLRLAPNLFHEQFPL